METSLGRTGRDRIAEEQAALRRVALLVARAASPDEVFAAVSEETGRVLGSDSTGIFRYNDDARSPGGGTTLRASCRSASPL